MSNWLQDLRYSFRILTRNARFSLTVILLLALGISGAVTMFTVVYQAVLSPLPFKNPDRLVQLAGAALPPTGNALEWWSQGNTFDYLCHVGSGAVNLTEGENPTRVVAAEVTSGFFSVFGNNPFMGRGFSISDEQPGSNYVVVISYRLWDTVFDRVPEVIGKDITLNGVGHKIIGTMPPGFNFPDSADVWLPGPAYAHSGIVGIGSQAEFALEWRNGYFVGRLRSGVSLDQARDRLSILHKELGRISGRFGTSPGSGVVVIPLQEVVTRDFRQSFWILFVGAIFLLLIACSNTANLMLSRSLAREKEIVIRLCLGVGGLRLARQLLIESMLLAFAGSVVGVILSFWSVSLFRYFGAAQASALRTVSVNMATLLFAVLVMLVIGAVIGMVPAKRALSVQLMNAVKEDGIASAGKLHRFTRQVLVVSEVSLTLVLLTGSGLVIQSFFRLSSTEPGFNSSNVLTLSVDLPSKASQPNPGTAEHSPSPVTNKHYISPLEFHKQLMETIGRLPGVLSVGGTNQLPLSGRGGMQFWVESSGVNSAGLAAATTVTGDYFQAMGIPLLKGRFFTGNELANNHKVTIISDALAKKFWKDKDPIGQFLTVDATVPDTYEVIGCVGDVKHKGLAFTVEPEFYLPSSVIFQTTIVVKTHGEPKNLIPLLRSQLSSIGNGIPIFRVRTLEEVISNNLASHRFRGILLGSFALLSLIMAVVGVYGVISYSVASRRREIGIRMSLGAAPRNILLMVLQEGLVLIISSLIIGNVVILWVNRLLSNLLFGIGEHDPLTIVLAALSIVVGVLLGCIHPALAASKIDPALCLRHD